MFSQLEFWDKLLLWPTGLHKTRYVSDSFQTNLDKTAICKQFRPNLTCFATPQRTTCPQLSTRSKHCSQPDALMSTITLLQEATKMRQIEVNFINRISSLNAKNETWEEFLNILLIQTKKCWEKTSQSKAKFRATPFKTLLHWWVIWF